MQVVCAIRSTQVTRLVDCACSGEQNENYVMWYSTMHVLVLISRVLFHMSTS